MYIRGIVTSPEKGGNSMNIPRFPPIDPKSAKKGTTMYSSSYPFTPSGLSK